jgi:dTDP-4-amino-4,6-dideoxygalactose transaminase
VSTVSLSTNSGTSALHLAYLAAGIESGDTVLCPALTCTATNIPLLYLGAKIKWVDTDKNSMNISIDHLESLVDQSVKAIVIVHYGGIPVDLEKIKKIADPFGITIIQDAAHALGAKVNGAPIIDFGDYTVHSFQAIKHITTGDGGMLSLKNNSELVKYVERLRWFGIDRRDKQKGTWENDITEIGYKYQMTDISAALGLAGLQEFEEVKSIRKSLYNEYVLNLRNNEKISVLNPELTNPKIESSYWLFTIEVKKDRDKLINLLRSNGIESGLVHYRNDSYKIFEKFKSDLPNLDFIESRYLSLPLHTHMTLSDVNRICDVVNSDW